MAKVSLSKEQRAMRYSSSVVFTTFLVWFFLDKGLLRNRETYVFEASILLGTAAVVVYLLRRFCRDYKGRSEPSSK
jgi:hypothetical protein